MFGMIVLSGIILALFASTRVPGIFKMWGRLQHAKHADELRPKLPKRLRYITDNYNHIFEQPTLFYAVVIYIFLMEHTDNIHARIGGTIQGLTTEPYRWFHKFDPNKGSNIDHYNLDIKILDASVASTVRFVIRHGFAPSIS
jgi:hypothetical protein